MKSRYTFKRFKKRNHVYQKIGAFTWTMPMFQAFQAIECCILLVILFLDDNLIMPLPSGYLTVCYGTSPFLIGKPSIFYGDFPWLCTGVVKCPILGILDITKNSSHLVDQKYLMESNGWVMWKMGTWLMTHDVTNHQIFRWDDDPDDPIGRTHIFQREGNHQPVKNQMVNPINHHKSH